MIAPLRRPYAALALVLSGCFTLSASAQQFVPTGRDTLRGLPGVEVLVEPMEPWLEQGGLSARELRADAERQLRAGGVVVYASQSENLSVAKPYVYLQITGIAMPRTGYAIEVQVHLRQTLRSPVTSASIVNAMTWDQHTVLVVPAGELETVRAAIREALAQFIADWRDVH